MQLSNAEYIPLRLLRRFVLSDRLLLRYGQFLPYYRTNHNQVDPAPLVDSYSQKLAKLGLQTQDRTLLEIGVGRTNSTCYEMAARFAPSRVYAHEPFVTFGATADDNLLRLISKRHGCHSHDVSRRVSRISDLSVIPDDSVDLVLSSSVLEHVTDPPVLFKGLARVMTKDGAMLHLVDYRDHFFKYPYHFLQFSKNVWNGWLNPGDLPVWRLYDHIEQLQKAGFNVTVVDETRDLAAFRKISRMVSRDYRLDDERLMTTTAALWVARARQP